MSVVVICDCPFAQFQISLSPIPILQSLFLSYDSLGREYLVIFDVRERISKNWLKM